PRSSCRCGSSPTQGRSPSGWPPRSPRGGAEPGMRYGVSAAASVQVLPGERQRIRWSQAWPILLRPTGDDRVHLVQGAGGPLGGDELSLTLAVGAGARLDLRGAAATVVQPGADGGCARWSVTAAVAGCLHWAPEPSIVTDGAELDSRLRIDVAR